MKNTPITENHLYRKAYSNGKNAVGRYVAVYALRDRANPRLVKEDPCHRPLNRLGLTTGKKIGGAVQRSRARRLMREAYRLIEKDGLIEHGYLLVLAARVKITEADMNEVKKDLIRSFGNLKLLRSGSGENK